MDVDEVSRELADHDVIEYDAASGVAAPAAGFEEFRSFVRHDESLEQDHQRAPTPQRPRTSGLSD